MDDTFDFATAYDVLLEALGRLTARYERDSEREKEAFRAKELGVAVDELRRRDEEAKAKEETCTDTRFMSTDGFLYASRVVVSNFHLTAEQIIVIL